MDEHCLAFVLLLITSLQVSALLVEEVFELAMLLDLVHFTDHFLRWQHLRFIHLGLTALVLLELQLGWELRVLLSLLWIHEVGLLSLRLGPFWQSKGLWVESLDLQGLALLLYFCVDVDLHSLDLLFLYLWQRSVALL